MTSDKNSRPNIYAGLPLDRRVDLRHDPDRLADLAASRSALAVPVWSARNLVCGGTDTPQAILPPLAGLRLGSPPVFLGCWGETPLFAVDLGDLPDTETALALPALAGWNGRFEDLRAIGPLMSRDEAGILAFARALVWWNRQTRFCGICGHPTVPAEGGFVRRCTNADCGREHFPRTDPAVIMLVHDGADRVVMARQKVWVPGMHSVLAGFVEPGESLEEAVAREVREEVGIGVTDVRYHSSQPWPFPCSLMLGFFARAIDEHLIVDTGELETAFWVDRRRLRNLGDDDPLKLPRLDSIAYRLLREWITSGD